MADVKTSDETTLSPVTGNESVRVASAGANFKVTIANMITDFLALALNEIGIAGAAVSGIALKVVGSIRASVGVEVGDGTSTITQPGANQLLFTASDVVLTGALNLVDTSTKISQNAADQLRVTASDFTWFTGNIKTAADVAWNLGAAAGGTDTADTLIRVTIAGVDYDIHATAV